MVGAHGFVRLRMSRLAGRFLVCAVLGVTYLQGAAGRPGGKFGGLPSAQEPAPGIQVVPENVVFAGVPVGEKYTQSVRLTNLSTAPVRLLNIASPSEKSLVISGVNLPSDLAAGASTMFVISYQPRAEGNSIAQIVVTTSGGGTPVTIGVRMSAIKNEAELTASEASLDFEDIASGGRSTKHVSLANAGNGNVEISRIEISGEGFSVSGAGAMTLSPGQSAGLDVTFEGIGVGAKSGALRVFSNTAHSTLEIPLSGTSSAASSQAITLRWEKNETAVNGYFVYRAGQAGGQYTKLQTEPILGAEFTDSGLAAGHTYYYVVTSLDGNNAESDYSEPIVVNVPEV